MICVLLSPCFSSAVNPISSDRLLSPTVWVIFSLLSNCGKPFTQVYLCRRCVLTYVYVWLWMDTQFSVPRLHWVCAEIHVCVERLTVSWQYQFILKFLGEKKKVCGNNNDNNNIIMVITYSLKKPNVDAVQNFGVRILIAVSKCAQ